MPPREVDSDSKVLQQESQIKLTSSETALKNKDSKKDPNNKERFVVYSIANLVLQLTKIPREHSNNCACGANCRRRMGCRLTRSEEEPCVVQ